MASGMNVGSVFFDLGFNKSQFDSGIKASGNSAQKVMGSAMGKIGGMVIAAFSVKAVLDFGKACVNLGSDLAEVQNVVDVTFGSSSGIIDDFAKNSIEQFGVAELSAKQYAGTMGAMLKSMKIAPKQVTEMSTAMVGLAGDMASFYNLETDEAFSKIRSGISGETEPLKQLGINMSVANMEAFALSQGITQSYNNMDQASQALLRYNYLMSVTADSQGDFARNIDSWANQTRVLKLQFQSLQATLGQAFIAVIKPVVMWLNTLMKHLVKAAQTFKGFIYYITGTKDEESPVSDIIPDIDAATDGFGEMGKAAKKAQKQLFGFDEMNIQQDNSGDGGGSGAGAGMPSIDTTAAAVEALDSKIGGLGNTLSNAFKDMFKDVNFNAIKTNFQSILTDLKPIAVSAFDGLKTVFNSFLGFGGKVVQNVGKIAFKGIEIGTGGIAKFLNKQSPKISQWITTTSKTLSKGFDSAGGIVDKLGGSWLKSMSKLQPEWENAIADVLTAISDGRMLIGTVWSDMFEGLTTGIDTWLGDNEETVGTFFTSIQTNVIGFVDVISGIFIEMFAKLSEWWNSSGKPIFDGIVAAFMDVVGWVMTLWNEAIGPLIDYLWETIGELWDNHLGPFFDKFLELVRAVWEAILFLWNTVLKPAVDWIITYVVPTIKTAMKIIFDIIADVIGMIIDVFGGLIRVVTGIIDFIVGVFTGDWEKAWKGVVDIFGGIWDMIWGIVKGIVNLIIDGLNLLWTAIYSVASGIVNGLGSLIGAFGSLFGQDWSFSMPTEPPLIPRLAQGGYIGRNQPTLAMIGDNTREGEIVAPESKLAEAVKLGLMEVLPALAGMVSQMNNGQAEQMAQIIIQFGNETLLTRIISLMNDESRRQGRNVIKVQ